MFELGMPEELKGLYTQNQFPGELFEFSFCYFCFFSGSVSKVQRDYCNQGTEVGKRDTS